MRDTILSVLIGLAAGFAVVRWLPSGAPEAPTPEPVSAALRAPSIEAAAGPSTPTRPLAIERSAEQPPLGDDAPADEASVDDGPAPASAESRIDGLVAVGFTPARAAEILQRETELRRAAYFAEFEASGTVRALTSRARDDGASRLRAELGDRDYERYLEGTRQARSVVVRAVEADSPAAHAGLVPGDEILSYAGQRIFNQRDLNTLMLEGTRGEVVSATVVRDGVTLELYVTRGPLGLM
jgi:membrane-associated protease RseP (regulator of RpoE activity)